MSEDNHCQTPINHLINEVGEDPKDKSFLIKAISIGVAISFVICSATFAVLSFVYAIKKFDL